MNKDRLSRIVFTIMALAVCGGVNAGLVDADILENCQSLSAFAEMAKKDRDRHDLKAVLPHYYERGRKNLGGHGYAPVLSKDDERVIRAAAVFMFADKTRTVKAYVRACLLAQEDTSPGWYLGHIKKYGMPPAMEIIAGFQKD